jgi:hypothetical protein
MSLAVEAPSVAQRPPAIAGSTFMEAVIADLSCHRYVPNDTAQNPYFQTSLELVDQWSASPGHTLEDADIMLDYIMDLPHDRTVDIFHRNTLLSSLELVSNPSAQLAENEVRSSIRRDEAERALDLQGVLDAGDTRHPHLIKQALGGACVTSLLSREGLAMPLMPHENLNYDANRHAGKLIGVKGRTLKQGQRYAVVNNCGGFAEGHITSRTPFFKDHFKRVRILSVCCDLSLDGTDGRRALPRILGAMQRELDGEATTTDTTMLDSLGQSLTDLVIRDESRKGRRATERQKNIHYFASRQA